MQKKPGDKVGLKARLFGQRVAVAGRRTFTGLVWLLLLLVTVALLGGTLLISEGARTLIGYESVGQKIDRLIARANGGVADVGESVRDRAVVATTKVERTGKEINDHAVATFDAGAARVDATAEAVRGKINAVGTGVTDAAITASIKADLLKDPYLSALRVDVDTLKGEVTLRGEAGSAASRERAERMASAVAGVTRVNNQLLVAGVPAVAGK